MNEPSRTSYEFGPFVVERHKRLLFRNGNAVPLAPKVFETLLVLIENRESVVSKDQLIRLVWGDTAVEEGGLARNVSLLRKALGEKPEDHRYIVTVPARGYRFVADVRPCNDDTLQAEVGELPAIELPLSLRGSEPPLAGSTRSTRFWWSAIAGMLLVGLVAARTEWLTGVESIVRSGSAPALRLVRLTSTSGLNIDPALSPDGSLLAYASDRSADGNLDVWVQPVRGGEATRITSGSGDEVEPSFSPDGSLIVFAGGETGGIYVVGALGGEPRLLAQGARTRRPRFSPDGRSVLFWTGQTAWVSPLGASGPGVTGSLGIVPAAGGAVRALAHDFASARYPVWSPDGTKILFLGERSSSHGPQLDWYVIDSAGGEAVATGALDRFRQIDGVGTPIPDAWMQTGTVVFTTTDETTSNVWQLAVSANSGFAIGRPQRLTFGTGLERSVTASGGGHLAFASVVENVDVWRVALDAAAGEANGTLERLTDNAGVDRVMNVSSDDRWLVFVSSRTRKNEVWLKDLAGGGERQLSNGGAVAARMTPDGHTIAMQRRSEGGVELYTQNGREPVAFCDDCLLGGWSSNGSRMLIARGPRGAARRLFDRHPSGAEVEVTSHTRWSMFNPRFSFDDRWAAFHTPTGPGLRQIYAVPIRDQPVDAADWVPVVTDFGIYPNWSPRGDGMYHFSFRDGYMCAWLQPVDGETKHPNGAPRPVQHFHRSRLRSALRTTATNDVTRRFMYMTLTESTGNIWMLEPHDDGHARGRR